MMTSDGCRVHPVGGRRVRPAGRLDGAYWLIGPGSAGLAQGCRCAVAVLGEAYRGGRPPTASCSRNARRRINQNVQVYSVLVERNEVGRFFFYAELKPRATVSVRSNPHFYTRINAPRMKDGSPEIPALIDSLFHL